MHPGFFSSIPPSWRGVVVFILAALALSLIMEKEFPEIVQDELMFKKLEDVVSATLGFEPEHREVPTIPAEPLDLRHFPKNQSSSLNALENMDALARCMKQFPNDQAATFDCEKKFVH